MEAQRQTVLITGAAGFLGRHFLRYHVERGDEVLACDDFSGAEPLPWFDIAPIDAAVFLAGIKGPIDLAYHFAAPVGGRMKIEGDPLFNSDSLRLDSAFFRWAVGKVGIAVYPSSSAVYGTSFQGENNRVSLAEFLCDPGSESWYRPDEMYGFTKLAGEMLAYKATRYGLNTLCIRPFSGYGPGQSFDYPVTAICARAKSKHDPLTVWHGDQIRDFIYVDDLVAATLKRLDAGIRGYVTYNIGSGFGYSFTQLADLAADLCGYTPNIKSDTTKPMGVFYRVADTTIMDQFYRPRVSLRAGLTRVIEALP